MDSMRLRQATIREWRSQTHGFEDMAAMRSYGGILSGVHSELPEVAQSAGGQSRVASSSIGISAQASRSVDASSPKRAPRILGLGMEFRASRRLTRNYPKTRVMSGSATKM